MSRVQKSETIGELAKALAAAQAEMVAAKENSENPFFKSKYADLNDIWDACRGPLTKHGLAVVQSPMVLDDGATVLDTYLVHSSGEWMSGRLPIKPVKNEPQAMGSALSYARRYALSALAGVSTSDDDANVASRNGRGRGRDDEPRQPPQEPRQRAQPDFSKLPNLEGSRSNPLGDDGKPMAEVSLDVLERYLALIADRQEKHRGNDHATRTLGAYGQAIMREMDRRAPAQPPPPPYDGERVEDIF